MTDQDTAKPSPLADKLSMLYHCADCNYCVDAVWADRHLDHVCPTLAHHSPALSYSGRGYMSLARAIHEGAEFPLDDIADRVFTCSGCGNCERVCPIGLSPRDVNVSLREILVENDAVPNALLAHRANLLSEIPPTQGPADSSLDMVDLLFASGCETAPDAAAEVRGAFEILKTFNANSQELGMSGGCCGTALAQLGFSSDAAAASQTLTDNINIYPRVGEIVYVNPKCQASLEADSRVISFPAWLDKQIEAEKLQLKAKGEMPAVTLMNICASNAWNQSVLNLLKRCRVAINNSDAGSAMTMCCGAGGGLPIMAPESAAKMAQDKASNLRESGAAESVTLISDPGCLSHLKSNQQTPQPPSARIYGLAEFLSTFFEISPSQASTRNPSLGKHRV